MKLVAEQIKVLREKRKELGITQIQAAHACGVSRRTYQTYEETQIKNNTSDELYKKLEEMGIMDGSNFICSIQYIKLVCRKLFKEKYPEVQCAYLFGSYARGEATGKSDIDLLVVCSPMDMKYYGMIAELEQELHKEVDMHTHRQLVNDARFAEQVLIDGIKIYG